MRPATLACATCAAFEIGINSDTITCFYGCDIRASLDHHARIFMTRHNWECACTVVVLENFIVGVTNATGFDLDYHIIWTRFWVR